MLSDNSKDLSVNYKCNNDGVRYEKAVSGSTTKYYLEGTSIVYGKKGTRTIYYLYDATGVIGLKYNDSTYLFEKNLQGDVIGIVDSKGDKVVTYEYDAWGKVLSIKDQNGNEISNQNHVGIINPFRYRGYYYDNETGLYYLNSRYYNPEWCSFINEDETIGEIGGNYLGHNMYQYFFNNPINFSDSDGS